MTSHNPRARWIQDAIFAAGWLTVGVVFGVIGGWWGLLAGPVVLAMTIMGGARYAHR